MPRVKRKKKKSKAARAAEPYPMSMNEDNDSGDGDGKNELVRRMLRTSRANKKNVAFSLDDKGWLAPTEGFLMQFHKMKAKGVRKQVKFLQQRSLTHSKKSQEGKRAKKVLRAEVKALQHEFEQAKERQLREFRERTPEQQAEAESRNSAFDVKSEEKEEEQSLLKLSDLAKTLEEIETVPKISFK